MARSGSTPSKKLDYKRELKELYGPRAGPPAFVDVPPLAFLMVDGMGDPNSASRGGRPSVVLEVRLSTTPAGGCRLAPNACPGGAERFLETRMKGPSVGGLSPCSRAGRTA